MGLFNFFKGEPSQNAILAQTRKAKEVYAQPEYRRMAMDKLLKWGNEESLKGLLERFTVVIQSPHWDEEEKRWLVEEFIKLGDKVLPILKEFVLKKNEVNHALLAFQKIAPKEAYKELLVEALKAHPPSDHRSVQGKQELIAAISEFEPAFFSSLLLPYLHDHSDDVQCAVIEALAKSDDEQVKVFLTNILSSESHSARVLRNVANIVAKEKIKVFNNQKLSEVIAEEFEIKSGYLERIRHAKKS